MFPMGDDESLLWNDDQSWAFPILPVDQENGGNILMNMIGAGAAEKPSHEEQPAEPKGKKKSDGKRPAGEGGSGEVKEGKNGESGDHEQHIWTERERRKKMRNMFSSLHSLIPNLHPRADKSTIVDEAVVYIKKLQQDLENLEKIKENGGINPTDVVVPQQCQSREAFLSEQGSSSQQPPPLPVTQESPNTSWVPGLQSRACFQMWASPNLSLNVCGNDAHYSVVCCPKKPGILSTIVYVMDKFNLEMVSATVSTTTSPFATRMYMIHSRVLVEGGQQQLPDDSFNVAEETFKLAAAELILWINS